MIIVTGANGKLGRAIVEHLLERVPAEQIGASVLDVEKARDLAQKGVRVRHGDFKAAATLTHAFEDATQVLIVSVNATGEEAVSQHRTAIEAAKQVGAGRVLYTSHIGSSPTSPFAPMPDHAATEAVLKESGLDYIALRNGFYADTAFMMLANALKTGELAVPEDGPVAWTTHTDLAEVAAIILSGESQPNFDGLSPNLTAAEAIDMEGLAAIAARLTNRPVRRVVVSDSAYRAGLVGHGVPAQAADMMVGLFQAARQGDFASTDPTLTRLIGRPSIALEDFLKGAISQAS